MKKFLSVFGTICAFVFLSGCGVIDNVSTDLIVDVISVNGMDNETAIPESVDVEKIYAIGCEKIIEDFNITRTLNIPGKQLIPYRGMVQLPVELELRFKDKRIRYYLGGVIVFDDTAEEVFIKRAIETILKILKDK